MDKIGFYLSNLRNLGLSIFSVSIFTLSVVYLLQYGFNILPCPLCYEQRKPYMLNIILGLITALVANKSPRSAFFTLMLCGTSFIIGIGIAAFHIGVEHAWWEGLSTCGGGVGPPQNVSVEELVEYFKNAPIVDCRVGWKFLGISLTEYNLVFSVFFAAVTFYYAIKGRKHGQKT